MTKPTASSEPDGLALLGVSPIRAAILQLVLAQNEVTAAEVMDALDLTRNGVRNHLKELTSAGFLTERSATHPRGTGGLMYWRADRDRVARALWDLTGRILGYDRG